MGETIKAAAAKSWKTTAAGALAGVAILCHQLSVFLDADPLTVVSPEAILTALGMIGVGLFARDSNVTSEAAGLKP